MVSRDRSISAHVSHSPLLVFNVYGAAYIAALKGSTWKKQIFFTFIHSFYLFFFFFEGNIHELV